MAVHLILAVPALLILLHFLLSRATAGVRRSGDGRHRRLPPGPWTLPVIGSLHHLAGSSLPHRAFRDLSRRHGPVMLLKLGELPVLVISSPEAAREVLKNHDIAFADRALSSTIKYCLRGLNIVWAPYGDQWRQLRKICTVELLSSKRVKSFRRVREEETASLLQSIATADGTPAGLVNITKKLRGVVSDITARAVLGDRCAEREAYLDALAEIVQLLSGFNLVDLFPSSRLVSLLSTAGRRIERHSDASFEILRAIVRRHEEGKHREAGREEERDLIDVLLRIKEDNTWQLPLDEENIGLVVADLFGAGSETAATTVIWAMAELAKNPNMMQKIQTELRQTFANGSGVDEDELGNLSYFQSVIKETLRRHTPAPFLLPHQSREDCRILGYDIPKGIMVIVNAWAIANDLSIWGDAADEFNPERFASGGRAADIDMKGGCFELLPFGSGRRICPGMQFGLANVEAVLASLLFHFDWELPEGMAPADLDMTEAMGIALRKNADLWLRPVLRFPPRK